MKQILFFGVFFLLFSCNRVQTDYDVIIVGGGLAGLSAAKELNSKKVLVLEKDSVLGGRVQTANFENKYFYDLGAVFALDNNYRSQIKADYNEFVENKPIAFWINNNLYSGDSILDCLLKIPNIDTLYLKQLQKAKQFNSSNVNKELYQILNTNMKAVFPGSLKEYNYDIQKYAFERYNSSHFKYGNQIVTQSLLENKKYEIQKSSKVIVVEDKGDKVMVVYEVKNKLDTLYSKKVIVATPATIAKNIIKKISVPALTFIEGIQYAGYYSIAIGVKGKKLLPDVSYLMPVNSGFASILKQKTIDDDVDVFQLYIAEEDFKLFKDDIDIKAKSIKILKDIWHINTDNILFYDLYFWKEAGVLVSNHYLKQWNDTNLIPSNNVYLAGDYCMLEYGMPYGMIPAIESGKKAAQLIKNK